MRLRVVAMLRGLVAARVASVPHPTWRKSCCDDSLVQLGVRSVCGDVLLVRVRRIRRFGPLYGGAGGRRACVWGDEAMCSVGGALVSGPRSHVAGQASMVQLRRARVPARSVHDARRDARRRPLSATVGPDRISSGACTRIESAAWRPGGAGIRLGGARSRASCDGTAGPVFGVGVTSCPVEGAGLQLGARARQLSVARCMVGAAMVQLGIFTCSAAPRWEACSEVTAVHFVDT